MNQCFNVRSLEDLLHQLGRGELLGDNELRILGEATETLSSPSIAGSEMANMVNQVWMFLLQLDRGRYWETMNKLSTTRGTTLIMTISSMANRIASHSQ
jgi:hypothetical protein